MGWPRIRHSTADPGSNKFIRSKRIPNNLEIGFDVRFFIFLWLRPRLILPVVQLNRGLPISMKIYTDIYKVTMVNAP
jgi:hypothetical protein